MKERNLSIDLVKIIAMCMVLALHINLYQNLPKSLALSLNYGIACIAIPLFFMVSGFLLTDKNITFLYSKRKILGILKFVFTIITFWIVLINLYDYIRLGYNPAPHFHLGSYFDWIFQGGDMWQYWYFASMIFIYLLSPILCKLIHSKYLKYILICTIIISFVFFIIDCHNQFEKFYIKQTFRIWYWIMYFLLGGYMRINQNRFKRITWPIALLVCLIYTIFQYLGPQIGNEFYFGSILCMFYAICVFSACLKTNITVKNKYIPVLSSLFLPVYTTHPILYGCFTHLIQSLSIEANFLYIVTLILFVSLIILANWLLMKIPYMNKVFKI